MNLETWIVVWLQIGLVSLALSLFCRSRIHASVRQAASRMALVLIPVIVLLNAGSWRKSESLPPAPIWYATPVAKYVEAKAPAGPLTSVPTTPEPGLPELPLSTLLTAAWAVGAGLLLFRMGLGFRFCSRLKRRTGQCGSPFLLKQGAELGIAPAQLRIGDLPEPILMGVLSPTIYIPESLVKSSSEAELRAVLIHEATHIRNGDLRWRMVGELIRILFWPQPAVRLLLKALAQSDEERCDQQVLAEGVPSSAYANMLVTLAESCRDQLKVAGAVGFSSGLGRRVKLLLSKRISAPRDLSPQGKVGLAALQVTAVCSAFFLIGGAKSAPSPQSRFKPLDHVMTVSITDVDGSPVSSGIAYIQAIGMHEREPAKKVPISSGKLTIDPAKLKVSAAILILVKSEKSAYTFKMVWNGKTEVNSVRLEPKATVKGRVLQPDGKPAADSRITTDFLVRVSGEGSVEFILMPDDLKVVARTDSEGRFALDMFPVGTTFKFDCPDLLHTANVNRRIEVKSESHDAGEIRYEVGSVFEGRVTRNGKPAAGIEVNAQSDGEGGTAITDLDGRYRLTRLPADKYNIGISLSDEMEREVTARAYEGRKIKVGETISGVNFELIPGAVIRGKVTQGGKGKADVMVGIYGPARPRSGGWVQNTITDKNGEYMTRVPGGEQYVYIMEDLSRHIGIEGYSAEVTVKDGETKRVDLVYPE